MDIFMSTNRSFIPTFAVTPGQEIMTLLCSRRPHQMECVRRMMHTCTHTSSLMHLINRNLFISLAMQTYLQVKFTPFLLLRYAVVGRALPASFLHQALGNHRTKKHIQACLDRGKKWRASTLPRKP